MFERGTCLNSLRANEYYEIELGPTYIVVCFVGRYCCNKMENSKLVCNEKTTLRLAF